MATLSAYPLDRGRGIGGRAVLRLLGAECATLIRQHGERWLKENRFVLRGSLRPFRAELLPNDHGNSIVNHGNGRMQLVVRFEDLHPLDPGDDVKIEKLMLRVEDDGSLWLMQTSDTQFKQTSFRRPKVKPSPSRELVRTTPATVPTVPAEAFEAVSAEDVEPPKKPLNRTDFATIRHLFNQLLDEQGAKVVEIEIVEGRLGAIRLTREDII